MVGFEKLRIWQKANDLRQQLYKLTKLLPSEYRFRIKDQLDRSASSVGANIAEGYASYYYNDKIKCFYISRKEAAETQNHIRVLENMQFITKATADKLVEEYEGLIKGINAYINYICSKKER
jgi:four helix bundle protein